MNDQNLEQTDTDAAREVLAKEKQARITACAEAIKAALETNRCQIGAIPQINAEGRIVATVQIGALD